MKKMNSRLSALILLLLVPGSSQQRLCAVKESDVTLWYSDYDINIKTVFWFSKKQRTNWRNGSEPEDLTLDSDYSGRVKHQISSGSSALKISDVRETDSGEYQLMFIMKNGAKHLSSAAVSLTVTGVSQSSCWDVTYTSRRVCAVVGSTVEISSTYSHPPGHTVNKTFWHYGPSGEAKDLREEHQFSGRVEYVENKLRIKDLKISDSGEYRFRIITDLNQYPGSPGVILTVTGTQIKRSPATALQKEEVILSCSTNCTLSGDTSYIWYKNGRQVTDGFTKDNKLYLDSVSSEELQQYSCAVGDPVKSTAFSQYTVTLLVFLPQFLIIAVLWMLFFFKMHLITKPNCKEKR
ncbi:sialoadhesin-like isoform X3 [Puntigrus tetrazona]|uniref:sialoadhesin-like isoform X3 n=1 Tax=Puntigrus tetrazona TaxID=1606681 RepID=UPI001C8AD3CA|nr:sialoadhesin-like isoform X3 [Puntigrus tetrazona]